ncbi:MAG TPA: hypothetical protein VKW77_03885 [Acidimicrobiales bacterium]|nr:hypothetical protein [Acidimicrobiales bacterium]
MDASPTTPPSPGTTSPNIQIMPVPVAAPAEIGPEIGPTRTRRGRHLLPPPEGHVKVRGATSIGSLFTGALVAWAAVVLFALIARGAASYAGYKPAVLDVGGARTTGLLTAGAIGLGLVLAFLWGGYTAGRMARGRGWIHGLVVAVLAAVAAGVGVGLAALVRSGPGLHLGLHLPAGYPRVHFLMAKWVAATAGGALALVAAVTGGALGTGWHGRLERRAAVEEQERTTARNSFKDLREALSQPEPIEPDGAEGMPAGARPNVFPSAGTPSPGVTG